MTQLEECILTMEAWPTRSCDPRGEARTSCSFFLLIRDYGDEDVEEPSSQAQAQAGLLVRSKRLGPRAALVTLQTWPVANTALAGSAPTSSASISAVASKLR